MAGAGRGKDSPSFDSTSLREFSKRKRKRETINYVPSPTYHPPSTLLLWERKIFFHLFHPLPLFPPAGVVFSQTVTRDDTHHLHPHEGGIHSSPLQSSLQRFCHAFFYNSSLPSRKQQWVGRHHHSGNGSTACMKGCFPFLTSNVRSVRACEHA